MHKGTVQKSNVAMKRFEYMLDKMIKNIDKAKKKELSNSDYMNNKLLDIDIEGNRLWGPW